MARIQFDQEELQTFYIYIKQRLSKVPLNQLFIKSPREPNPSVSISGNSKQKSKSSDQSKSEHSRSEGSVKDIAQSKEKHGQQVLSPKQAKTPTNFTKPIVVDLEGEWENFNKVINTEEQSTKPLTNCNNSATGMEVEGTINTQETGHIPVASSSEIVLSIEEIPPLDVFYSPQHKSIIRRQ